MRLLAFVTVLSCIPQADAFLNRVKKDWAALNMRSTTRHLMRPLTTLGREQCVAIKAALRESDQFVVDAFIEACAQHSSDSGTASNGGLLGELLPQGAIAETWGRQRGGENAAALDRACFTAPLGTVYGPLESDYGWHLVLVEQRVGCRFDDGMVKIVPQRRADGRWGSVLSPSEPGDGTAPRLPLFSMLTTAALVLVLGQAIAELAGMIAPMDLERIANDMGL